MTTLVLHDLGDADGAAGWRVTAPAGWHVLDLPGHGTAPAPRQGHYDPMAAVTLARWVLAERAPAATALGVGESAHTACILAAGGACGRLVLVDGLWGAVPTAAEAVHEMYATIRAIVDDPAATAPPPEAALDPRATYGYGITIAEPFLQRFWGAITVPVLAVETPASPTAPGRRAERLAWFAGPTTLVETASSHPSDVVAAVMGWQ